MESSAEHKMWLVENKSNGTFSGAIIDIKAPIVSNKQWQIFLNSILENFTLHAEDESNIDGSYAFSFTPSKDDNYAGMLVSKILGESFEDTMTVINLPEGSLGLLHIFSDPVYSKVAVLSLLAGDFSDKGDFTPNRILAAAKFGDEIDAIRRKNISPLVHDRVLEIGRSMLLNLDSSLIVQGYDS